MKLSFKSICGGGEGWSIRIMKNFYFIGANLFGLE